MGIRNSQLLGAAKLQSGADNTRAPLEKFQVYQDDFGITVSLAVVSVCSEKNPCKNGGRCVEESGEEELQNIGVKNAGKSRKIVVRKYSVSRCVCRDGFSGHLCQHGKSPSRSTSFHYSRFTVCLSTGNQCVKCQLVRNLGARGISE